MAEQTINNLIRKLYDADAEVRNEGAAQLTALAASAVEALIGVLRRVTAFEIEIAGQQNVTALHIAEDALVEIGEPAVMPLIGALNEDVWGARFGAIYCLGEIGDVRAVQPLINLLETKDVNVTVDVGEALLKIGGVAVRPLMFALANAEPATRRGAAFILSLFADPLATPALIAALEDDNAEVRASAAHALGSLADARAVEPLIAAQKDVDPAVREAIIRALGDIGLKLPAPSITSALVKAMHDKDWGTRQSAAEMLVCLESDYAESARWALVTDLQDHDPEVRLGAAWSLLPVREQKAVDTLLQLLEASDVRVSSSAALALGQFGDSRAIPSLTALLRHEDDQVRHAAQSALRQLGDEGNTKG